LLIALEAAHSKGIVLAIKPANIFVTRAGKQILDFGWQSWCRKLTLKAICPVMRRPKDAHQSGRRGGNRGLHVPGSARTEIYARTDLFSFGIVLYEMGPARQVFTGARVRVFSILSSTGRRFPASSLNPSCRPFWSGSSTKHWKRSYHRYQSAHELIEDLALVETQLRQAGGRCRRPVGPHPAGLLFPASHPSCNPAFTTWWFRHSAIQMG